MTSDIVAELETAVRKAHDTGSSSVSVDLPTGDDLLAELERLRSFVLDEPETDTDDDVVDGLCTAAAALRSLGAWGDHAIKEIHRLRAELADTRLQLVAQDDRCPHGRPAWMGCEPCGLPGADAAPDRWKARYDDLAMLVRRYLRAQSRGNLNIAERLYQELKDAVGLEEADDADD